MFKYTKSLATVALALTCSLSLVSCGGGGGGGGGGAATAPENGGTADDTTNKGDSEDNKNDTPAVEDYAWETDSVRTKTVSFEKGNTRLHVFPDGRARVARPGSWKDGYWRYTKLGVNKASLTLHTLKETMYTDYGVTTITVTIDFESKSSAYLNGTQNISGSSTEANGTVAYVGRHTVTYH